MSTIQRIVSGTTASSTSHTLSVQVDAASNRALLVCLSVAKQGGGADISGSPERDSQSLSQVGAGNTIGVYGSIRFYLVAAPNTGTANLTWSTNVAAVCRAVAYVLSDADASTAAFVLGTNGTTITFAHTGLTLGSLVIAAAKRSTSPTWTAGGGLTDDSNVIFGADNDRLAVGSLTADATSESPTWTLSGGESGSNLWGSVSIAPAPSGPENLKNWAPIWGDIWGDIWATDDDPAPSGPGFRGYYGACV
jgi:hypothetical protein